MTDLVLGIGAVAIVIIIGLVTLVPAVKQIVINKFRSDKNVGLILTLALSLAAMLGSLWYSEILQYTPCKLCWYQRIFMYPIVLISFIGYVLRDFSAFIYIRALALVGLAVSIFHIIEQRLPETGLSCGTVGQSANCGDVFVNAFGVVTIPTMAATIFIAILIVISLINRTSKS